MSVESAVERELKRMGGTWRESVHGATALALAAALDDEQNSATSRSMVAKELRETMVQLRALAPPVKEADAVDDIATQRAKRRAAVRGAAAADL